MNRNTSSPTTHRRRHRGPGWVTSTALAGATVAVALAAAGCGPDADSPAPERAESTTVQSPLDVPAMGRPGARSVLDALRARTERLDGAQEQLVQRCMTAHGLPYTALNVHSHREPLIPALTARIAATTGYGRGPDPAAGGDTPPAEIAHLSSAERTRWFTVLQGPDDGPRATVHLADGAVAEQSTQGCVSQAATQLYGTLDNAVLQSGAGANLTNATLLALSGSPDASKLETDWSTCMTATGHPDLDTPSLAQQQAQHGYGRLPDAEALTQDRALATADVSCRERVDYANRWQILEDRWFTAAVDRDREPIHTLTTELHAAETRAQALDVH